MKRNEPEKAIEYEIFRFFKSIGIFAWKVDRQGTYDAVKQTYRTNKHPWKITGVSDIHCVIEGRFVAIEVKAPEGKLSDSQRVFLANVNSEGGIGFVARSVSDVALELSKQFPANKRFQDLARQLRGVSQH